MTEEEYNEAMERQGEVEERMRVRRGRYTSVEQEGKGCGLSSALIDNLS